jgi:hypothetical protein
MANRPWLESVRRQLADNGLPPAYIRRFMEELADHYQDACENITEENMSTENDVVSRLGEPRELADAAIYAFRRRTFLGRHPAAAFLVFGVAPSASLLGLFVLAFACLYGGCSAWEWLGFDLKAIKRLDPAASIVLPYLLSLLMVIIPAALASLLYCKLIARCGISRRWIILSSVVLAIVAILPIWTVSLSDQPGQSVLRCGIGCPQDIAGTLVMYFSSFQQWLQFLTPLCVGWWFLRRMHKDAERSEEPLRLAA